MKRIYVMLSLALVCLTALAIPAKRGQWRDITLADGSVVKAQLMGDEHVHYYQTETGLAYTLNTQTERYEAADLQAMQLKAQARRQQAQARRNKRLAPKKVGTYGNYTGSKKGLIILVQYTDVKFKAAHTQELYNRIANEEGFTSDEGFIGSVHDYFKAQSNGQFDLTFDVMGPVQLAHNQAYYGRDYGGEGNDQRPWEMVTEGIDAIKDEVNLADYDWDGDGEVDQVFILYAGLGQANGGSANTVWPHEFELSSARGYAMTVNGIKIDTYGCSCELQPVSQYSSNTTIDGLGTICHEFSHCLGYPDMYDINYGGNYGMGSWDLMDMGSYNGDGFVPANYTGYEKMVAGWKQPVELTGEMTVENVKSATDNGDSYIIYNKGHKDEYYILDNRQKKGWDAQLEDKGLLIMHVDYNATMWSYNIVNTNVTSRDGYPFTNDHQRCHVVRASNGANDYNYYGYSYTSGQGDTYPYGTKNSLTSTTNPSASVYNANTDGSKLLNAEVTDIKQNADGTVSFKFSDGNGGNNPGPDPQPNDSIKGGTLFYESFDNCAGHGGNDDIWSGASAGNGQFNADNEWAEVQNGRGGDKCARMGTGTKNGLLTTPEIQVNGTATLTFVAAPWNEEENFMFVEVADGYEATLSDTNFDFMTPKQWNEHTVTVTADGPVKLTLRSNKNRFFIDEVKLVMPEQTDTTKTDTTEVDPPTPPVKDEFVSIGTATVIEGALCKMYLDDYGNPMNAVTYEVEMEENKAKPGHYRLVDLYGTGYPYYNEANYTAQEPVYIEIHAENPDGVYIPRQQTGWADEGAYEIQSRGDFLMNTIYSFEEVMEAGMMGKLKDGVITFPAYGIIFWVEGTDDPFLMNEDAETAIYLPGVYKPVEPVTPTAIGIVSNEAADRSFYTLDGRYAGRDFRALAPGIYLYQGRKVIR